MIEFYQNISEVMEGDFEPATPCRNFDTRPCVELSLIETERFRMKECEPRECTRFPSRDQRSVP